MWIRTRPNFEDTTGFTPAFNILRKDSCRVQHPCSQLGLLQYRQEVHFFTSHLLSGWTVVSSNCGVRLKPSADSAVEEEPVEDSEEPEVLRSFWRQCSRMAGKLGLGRSVSAGGAFCVKLLLYKTVLWIKMH